MATFVLSSDAVQLVDYVGSQSYLAEADSTLNGGQMDATFGVWNQSGVELDRQNMLYLFVDADEATGSDPILRFLLSSVPELQPGESTEPFDLSYTLRRSAISREDGSSDRETSLTLSAKLVASGDGSEISLVSADEQKVSATLNPPYSGISSWNFDFSNGEVLGKSHTIDESGLVLDFYLLGFIEKNQSLADLYASFTGNDKSEMLDAEDYYIEIDGLPLTALSGEVIQSVGVTLPIDDDANQAPQWSGSVSDQTMDEEGTLTVDLSTVTATDPEDGAVTIAVAGGSSSTVEATLNEAKTQLQLTAASDYYTTTPLEIELKAADSLGGFSVKRFQITVNDVNDAPTAVSLSDTLTTLPEDSDTTGRTLIANIQVTDDTVGSNLLSLEGADSGYFELDGTALYLKSGAVLDHEADADYVVTISAADSGVTGSTPVTVDHTLSISDVNEAPTAVALNSPLTEIAENSSTSSRTKVADLVVTDDVLGTNTFSLSGTDAAQFEIIGTELFLKAGVSLDHESQSSFSLTIESQDQTVSGSSAVSANHTLSVSDQNEAPTVTSAATASVIDQAAVGTVLYTATASDPDAVAALSFSLGGVDAGRFLINSETGVITLNETANYDLQSSYALEVTVSDGELSDTQQLVVTVRDEVLAYYWGESDKLISEVVQNGDTPEKSTSTHDSDAISLTDVLLSLKYYLGKSTLSTYAVAAADYNEDQNVNLTDVLQILKSYLGKTEAPPAWHFEAEEGLPGGVELVGVLRGDVDGSWESSGT